MTLVSLFTYLLFKLKCAFGPYTFTQF